jgi:hypothetical protein
MVQVKAINTRKVHKVDGHTIFKIVQQMTGEDGAEINRVIAPKLVPMIGRNDADDNYGWHSRNSNQRVSWDTHQQVSWGNALQHMEKWTAHAKNYNILKQLIDGGAPEPPAWTEWHKKNKPVPWNTAQKETHMKKVMTDAFVSQGGWNNRQQEQQRCDKLSFADLKKEFVSNSTTFSIYHWRNKSPIQRELKMEEDTKKAGARAYAQWYENAWKTGSARWDPEVLMLAGENQPQYYMSWIIANTYHSTNPEVKNISSYQGRYKYRNWELKERYYPIINSGDTLPKTTSNWPRYPADPKILSIFTLPEMAIALKTTFAGKQNAIEQAATIAKKEHQDRQEEIKQAAIASHQIQRTITDLIAQGLDTWNDRRFNYQYTFYEEPGAYQTRKTEEVPVNERISLEWKDIKGAMGVPQFNKAIKEYADRAKIKHDRIIADAKIELDKALKQVTAAKGSKTTTPKAKGKSKSAADSGSPGLGSLFG